MLVMPAEVQWIIQPGAADLTSRSLRTEIRRGTLVVPVESGWIIKHNSADLTSRSHRKV